MKAELFPEIEPYTSYRLKVSPVHELYVEEVGNPKGQPVVFLHGGPGAGLSLKHRRYFDPKHYRIILFDQRGTGKSTPHASLEDNTTWHLVDDIEKIRKHLGIERWMVFGGSWGSTLALAYAETHPDQVTALVVRGIFLVRRSELLWFYQEGAHWIFPDYWKPYLDFIPREERGDMIAAYYKRLTSPDLNLRLEAARRWSVWEGSTLKLIPDLKDIQEHDEPHLALAIARIECHFFMNRGFFEHDDQLLRNAHRLKKIPGVIVHGRYDVVCPVKSAFDLKEVWSEAEFHVISDAGHAVDEPGIAKALCAATEKFKGVK